MHDISKASFYLDFDNITFRVGCVGVLDLISNIAPHVCRHTYCSNQAKAGTNPKNLQYLRGHSDISVTMNVYTHYSFDDEEEELKRMEEYRKVQAELEKQKKKPMSYKVFKAI